MSFDTLSFRVQESLSGREVIGTVLLSSAHARALAVAVSWRGSTQFLALPMESAEDHAAMRALTALQDSLEEVAASEPGQPFEMRQASALLLAEVVALYRANRDEQGYLPPSERERLGVLEELEPQLMDNVSHFAGASQEAEEKGLLQPLPV